VRRFIFAAIFLVIGWAPALADVRIVSSLGGTVGSYLSFFSRVRQSGERVIIDGPCISACTLVLSTIPRSRVCVTSRAILGFHQWSSTNTVGDFIPAKPHAQSWRLIRHGYALGSGVMED
jgi:hypothetical protein